MGHRRFRGDDGAATTEFVIAAPAFLFLLMLIVQSGLYFHAVSVASAAAQEGTRAAVVQGGTVGEGRRQARAFVDTLAPRLLTDVAVDGQVTDGGDAVRITVSGDVIEVFKMPGVNIDYSVHESSESVIERFRPATEAPPTDT